MSPLKAYLLGVGCAVLFGTVLLCWGLAYEHTSTTYGNDSWQLWLYVLSSIALSAGGCFGILINEVTRINKTVP